MAAVAMHLRLRLDAEYLAYLVMKQTLVEMREMALERPWEFDGEEAGGMATAALEIEASLVSGGKGGEGDGA